jgi:hypothetical protein
LLRVGRLLIVVAALGALAACGTQFVYNRLDWVLHYYLTNQVSLDSSQSRQLRVNLKQFVAWHRHHELPRYADFLERLADAAAKPMTPEQLETGRAEIGKLVEHLVVKASPDATRWLLALRRPQLDEFFANFTENETETRAKACDGDPAERRTHSTEKFIEGVEDWTGKLRRSQRELITRRLAANVDQACATFEMNARSWVAFRELIDQRRSEADFAAQVAGFLLHPEERWPEDYRRVFLENNQRLLALLGELDQTLTAEQRAHAIERMRDYSRDLRALAAASPE